MDKKFKYEFDQLTGIQYKFYFGLISIEDIASSWYFAFENNLIPQNVKGFILDYRNATFNFEIEDHIEISEFYKKHIDVFKNLKIAIITDKPKDVVIPILVKSKDSGYESRPFSTIEAAIIWVLK